MTSNVVITGGPIHDFDATTAALVDILSTCGVTSTVVDLPDEAVDQLADPMTRIDLLTFNTLRWRMESERHASLRADWAYELSESGTRAIEAHVVEGGGLLAMHTAVICFDDQPRWTSTIGGAWRWDRSSHPPVGPMTVQVTDAGRRHPLTAGLDDFDIVDEAYGFLHLEADVEPLLTTEHGGVAHPLLWARSIGRGRVVTDLLGHDAESFAHPTHREILRRATTWATAWATEDAR